MQSNESPQFSEIHHEPEMAAYIFLEIGKR
jgi:hypothetical protein